MGYEIGRGARRLFIDDDGSVWESPFKKKRLAGSLDEFDGNPPADFVPEVVEEPVEEKVEETKPEVPTCDICGFKSKSDWGITMHKKRKHKVK